MYKRFVLLWIVALLGSSIAAVGQTLPVQPSVTEYDGTYKLVGWTKVHETYMTAVTEQIKQCRDLLPPRTPIVIINGEAHRHWRDGRPLWEGTVTLDGDLAMRLSNPTPVGVCGGCSPGAEVMISGKIDKSGMLRARRTAYYCSYDMIWQRDK